MSRGKSIIEGNTNQQGQLRTFGRTINNQPAKGDSGVFGHNPNPGLGDPEAPSKTPRKFAETVPSLTGINSNQTRKSEGVGPDKLPTPVSGSSINRSKNQTRSQGATNQSGRK